MTVTVVRRDFRSVPHRDAAGTWTAIVDLLNGSRDAARRQQLLAVTGVVSSVITDQFPRESPIVATCEGPRTRIYCSYDDDALDDSNENETPLGYDALKGDWQVSLPVSAEDLAWVQAALKRHGNRVVAYDKDEGLESARSAQAAPATALALDVEGFMKS